MKFKLIQVQRITHHISNKYLLGQILYNEFISDELHTKLCSQLSEHGFEGVFVYAGFNEPLLHKKIYNHVKEAKKFLPKARIEIITNGDVLNSTRIKKLIDAGLTTLSISVYDGPDEAAKFQTMCENLNLRKDQFEFQQGLQQTKEDEEFK